MKLTDKYYGYPVISALSDDFEGLFSTDINVVKDDINEQFIISVRIVLENDDFHELLKSNMVSFSLHLEESRTCFREVHNFNQLDYTFVIPYGKVRENIEVCTFLTTTTEIQNFKANSMHEFYRDITINYEPYQIIGISNQHTIEVSMENDEIKNPSSIFSIIPDKENKEPFISVTLDETRIVIKMPEKDFELYYRLMRQNQTRNNNKDILLSNIVMPVMVQVLYNIKESEHMYDDKIWHKSLVKAFSDKGIDILSVLESNDIKSYYHAQIIFDSVISKSLAQVERILEA